MIILITKYVLVIRINYTCVLKLNTRLNKTRALSICYLFSVWNVKTIKLKERFLLYRMENIICLMYFKSNVIHTVWFVLRDKIEYILIFFLNNTDYYNT